MFAYSIRPVSVELSVGNWALGEFFSLILFSNVSIISTRFHTRSLVTDPILTYSLTELLNNTIKNNFKGRKRS
jgi:hypothetical protein